jgi:RNA polymerase sigma-70 factor (ECF subfamily)
MTLFRFNGHDRSRQAEFEEQTLPYLPSLYGFVVVLTGNRDDANDLVQDAYLRAFRFYPRYEHIANYKAWLFTLTKNLFINRYHQRAREISLDDLDILDDEPHQSSAGFLLCAHDRHARGIFRRDFEFALAAMPDKLRLAVLLRDIEGFDYKEMSEILGCPLGTVMSRLSRGRNLLKKSLSDYWASPEVKRDPRLSHTDAH